MASQFCAECGSPLRPGVRFCATCGATVAAVAEGGPQEPGTSPGQAGYASPGGYPLGGYESATGYPPAGYGGLGIQVGVQYAGFWVRFLALLIDSILLAIVGSVLTLVFGQNAGSVLQVLLGLGYYVYFLSQQNGQTIGCRALSIRVQDAGGQVLTPTAALIRYLGSIVSAIPLLLGYFWMIWDKDKQTWHDKFAKSYVVKV